MIAYLVRFIKRTSVLLPGLAVTYFVAKDLYPALEKRIPFSLALLATYILTAYGLIPLALRFVRLVFTPSHFPLYSTTPDGFASDPINIGIVASREELIEVMTGAGWFVADKRTPKSLFKMGLAILFRRRYRHAPFSTLYLLGRGQDIGFELPLDNNPLHRHHVRFWAASYTYNPRYQDDIFFWQQKQLRPVGSDVTLWVGAASLDEGLGVIRHNAQITHMISPNTNAERALVVRQLKKTGRVERVRRVKIGQPYRLRNRVWRGYLHADGQMLICELNASGLNKSGSKNKRTLSQTEPNRQLA